ncbi:hypothetical protein JMJ77_0008095, partial [Colletotrichum scovillei]
FIYHYSVIFLQIRIPRLALLTWLQYLNQGIAAHTEQGQATPAPRHLQGLFPPGFPLLDNRADARFDQEDQCQEQDKAGQDRTGST